MKFELEKTLRGASDETYLDDLRKCARELGVATITQKEYNEIGSASSGAFVRRFGTWGKALSLAGLEPSKARKDISDEELFENIKQLWTLLGRQPRYAEIKPPLSQFSTGPYENRFGTWLKALERFVEWVNADSFVEVSADEAQAHRSTTAAAQIPTEARRSRREISERQRFRILVRDGFRCKSCGASPIATYGVLLHIDHVLPWSKGGETVDDNLATKCSQCNLGKGNAFDV